MKRIQSSRTGCNLCVCVNVKRNTNGIEGVRTFTNNNNKTKYSGQNVNNDWRGSGFCVMETIFKVLILEELFLVEFSQCLVQCHELLE